MRVQDRFGGMWDESRNGGGMWNDRNFNGGMLDENRIVGLGYGTSIGLVGSFWALG